MSLDVAHFARRLDHRIAALVAVLLLVTACGAPHLTAPPPSKIDVATPQMVAMKAKSGIEDCPKPQVRGGTLPKMTLKCLGGGTSVDLSTLKGPLLINFFQSACTWCRVEMPALEAFHQKYGDRVPIIGIDTTDTYPGVALKQAIKRGVTYPLLADPGSDLQGTSLTVPNKLPTTYFLSADGKLVGPEPRYFQSVDQIVAAVHTSLGISL